MCWSKVFVVKNFGVSCLTLIFDIRKRNQARKKLVQVCDWAIFPIDQFEVVD